MRFSTTLQLYSVLLTTSSPGRRRASPLVTQNHAQCHAAVYLLCNFLTSIKVIKGRQKVCKVNVGKVLALAAECLLQVPQSLS